MNRIYVWTVPTAVVSVLALIVALQALATEGGGTEDISVARAAEEQVLDVELVDLAIEPAIVEAGAEGPITLRVRNEGAIPHNLSVVGVDKTQELGSGDSEELSLGELDPGTYEFLCDIPGHAEAGMVGSLVVGEGGGASEGPSMDAESMDAAYTAGLEAFPAETEGRGGQPMEPEIVDGVKVFELTADEIQWEVAPGDVQEAMAYNGQVPGPEIRVELGDRVRIVLHNELEESTSIHFHGLNVPNAQDGVPGLTQDLVKPGEDYTYTFTVPNAGSHMYHSHMNGAHQIPMGLLGAFVVEGPDDPEVDRDVTLVLNDGPLGYTINGKGFPATQPVVAEPGERIRIRYMNEGLQGHPMHLHGMEQLVIEKDGWPLPAPYRADTIWVAPGERYDTVVTAREGTWAFHCHILTHAEGAEGMFGMVTAMVVA